MSKYTIRLEPAGKFFFGGDMTFPIGSDKDKKNDPYKDHNQKFSSYIIHSNYFPQQTSILGMLRFLVLSHSNDVFDVDKQVIKEDKKEKVTELIGASGFCVPNNEGYGIIGKISPCFLQTKTNDGNDDWNTLLPCSMDYGFKIDFDKGFKALINGLDKDVPYIDEGFNPKKGIEKLFIAEDAQTHKLENIFVKDIRIGIDKDYTGCTKNSAFYKQINYRFNNAKNKYCFAFTVDIDDTFFNIQACSGEPVLMGADSSVFILDVEKNDTLLLPRVENAELKTVLWSDALIPEEVMKLPRYAICETIPFRYLKTSVNETQSYNILSGKVKRSVRQSLYSKGSVFYFTQKELQIAFEDALSSQTAFVNIGYNIHNHYKLK